MMYYAADPRPTMGGQRQPSTTPALRLWTLAEMATLAEPEWLVDGVLPAAALAEVHGPPASGKTFLMLDLALCVASGTPWHGRPVRQGRVVYIAAERFRGLNQRIRAWEQVRGLATRPDIVIADAPVQLLDEKSVSGFLRMLRQSNQAPTMIVLDTLSGCMLGGEENASRDMGRAVHSMLALRDHTGAAVVAVHHSTKDGCIERGHSVLRGRMDVMISATRRSGVLQVASAKANDFEPFEPMHLRMRQVGPSCVLEPESTESRVPTDEDSASQSCGRSGPLPPGAITALGVLQRDPDGLTRAEWQARSMIPPASLDRYAAALVERGFVERPDRGTYRITEAGTARLTA